MHDILALLCLSAIAATGLVGMLVLFKRALRDPLLQHNVRIFIDHQPQPDQVMASIPRVGDTVRYAGSKYAEVAEVVWLVGQPYTDSTHVNLHLKEVDLTWSSK